MNNVQKLLAEGLGTAFLLIGVVGSGIMGAALADGNTAIALLANAIATGCILYVIITTLGPISGAHFNPAVTLAFWLRGQHQTAEVLPYIAVQIVGGILGVWPVLLLPKPHRGGCSKRLNGSIDIIEVEKFDWQ